MKKISILLVGLLFVGMQVILAQTKQITGTVTSSDDGMPLPGVSVVVKGTSIGITTDIDGEYELNVPEDANTLVFSFVGMQTQEVAIDDRSTVDVVMQPDLVGLDEVVVVAYGTVKKEANTGSLGVVESDKLKDVPEVSVDKMLAGKVAGMVVTSTSGQPGASSQIRIRGTSSINAGNEPLYVVDGVPVMDGNQTVFTNTGNALSFINPGDIESVTVLKDAAAASIYGSRAANGVILITTKSGLSGKSRVNLRVSAGTDYLANDNDYGAMTAPEVVKYLRDAATNAGMDPDDVVLAAYADSAKTDWIDEMTRKGQMRNYELSVEGGNEKTTHFFSGSYAKNEGIFYGTEFDKYQFRTNLDHKVNDMLTVGTRINAGYTEAKDVAMQGLFFVNPIFAGMALLPWSEIYNEDDTYNLDLPEWFNTNPLASAEYDEQWEKQNRFHGTAYLSVEPIEGLTFKTTNSYEYTGGEGRRYWAPEADPNVEVGTLQTSNTRYRQLTTSNTANYDMIFDRHSFDVLVGQEATSYYYNYYYLSSPDVDPRIPFPTTSSSGADEGDYTESAYTLLSFFGVAYYNFDSRYYLQTSYRRDGSSRFGEDNRWGNFWSVGGSWNLHNEAFLNDISGIDQLKIRGSYGISGNYEIGNYEQYGLYGSVEYNGKVGMAPSQPSNSELGWETNAEYNLALDYSFLRGFVSGTVEVYDRTTSDMLLDYPLSRTSGFNSITQNIGEINNKGIEALIDFRILQGDFNWSIGANIAHNQSEIIDLGKDEQITYTDEAGDLMTGIIHKKGESLYSFYLYDWAGVNPVNGEGLWYNEQGEMTNQFSEARRVIAGSPEPKLTGGLNTNLEYMGIMLDATLEFKTGNHILIRENRYANTDGAAVFFGKNQANSALPYWEEPGDIVSNPKPVAGNTSNSNTFWSTRWMEEGDYLRIKNITLSYRLPTNLVQRANIANVRIFASASNLYTFHNVKFWDPERGVDGLGAGIYPMTKKFVLGVDLSF